MRAIVYDGTRAVVRDDVSVRPPGAGEVIVRMVAAGVCHSDQSVLDGTIPFPTPVVMGHEGAGVVEEVGSGVTSVAPGDHVVVTTLANCGRCAACSNGWPTRCKQSMGNMTQPFTVGGEPAWNFAASSVFAERTVVKEVQAVKIDGDVPLTSACLIGCGVVTGACCVWNRAMVRTGQTAVVFGVGGVGLNVIQALRVARASRIIAIDTVAAKETFARKFGATDFINPRGTDVVAEVREMLGAVPGAFGNGGGADWVFDCVGHPSIVSDGMEMLDWGGNVVILGVPGQDVSLSSLFFRMTTVDRGIIGCRYGSVRPHHDVPMIIDLYRSGQFMLDELVSATYPLDGFETVLHDLHVGRLARGVLTF